MASSLESQVCNLELSRKLKKLKVKQESVFEWIYAKGLKEWMLVYKTQLSFVLPNGSEIALHRRNEFDIVPAYSVAELGELLPEMITVGNGKKCIIYYPRILKKGLWEVSYFSLDATTNKEKVLKEMKAINEANARARMLIYLLENGLIKIELSTAL